MTLSESVEEEQRKLTTKNRLSTKDLLPIKPLTSNQARLFQEWKANPELNFFLYGTAGTGKTFSALKLAIDDVVSRRYEKILIVRSIVPAREIGYLPGDLEEKTTMYEEPYMSICDELVKFKNSYYNMKDAGMIEFVPTSFLRGKTFNDCIIIVDETQNLTFGELNTIITRVGQNSKIIFCGDIRQNDLVFKRNDVSGFDDFMHIISHMKDHFSMIGFTADDIVRSGLVRDYIIAKERLLPGQ